MTPTLRSPLRNPTRAADRPVRTPANRDRRPTRQKTLEAFQFFLRTTNNRDGRPYATNTIDCYLKAARSLSRWLTAQGDERDYLDLEVPDLNAFFRHRYDLGGQGGASSVQQQLGAIFRFVYEEQDLEGNPMRSRKLARYAVPKTRPKTLSRDYIKDLLQTCGGIRSRNFLDTRDYAIIRILCEGVRRSELLIMDLDDVPSSLYKTPLIRLKPLKGERRNDLGRLVPLSPASVDALERYLKARSKSPKAHHDALWLVQRGPYARFGPRGLYAMLDRRSAQAGWAGARPHGFRHTFSHDWLAGGGSEGDLMRLNGWTSRVMLDRYGADLAEERAVAAKLQRGDIY